MHSVRNEDDVTKWTADDVATYMYGIKIRHGVSDNAFSALWDGFRKVLPALNGKALPSARTVKRSVLRDVPTMKVDVAYLDLETKERRELFGLSQVPRKTYQDRERFAPVYEIWRVDLEDVVAFHRGLHDDAEGELILNIDGVPIGRTGRSQTVVSVKFKSCRNVYQVTNAIPFGETKSKELSVTTLIGDVLRSIAQLDLTLMFICADAPMRAFLRNQKAHTASLGCDYCFGRASHRSRPIWGPSTLKSESRTTARLKEDYERVAKKEITFADFGYKGRSEILNVLPDFDVIDKVPVDPMHLLFLGVCRSLFELLFAVGENRPRKLSTPRQSTKKLDYALGQLKVPSEMPRRARAMDYKNWKGSEWRALVLFYFPIVVLCLRPGIEREIWLEFCYLCRAYSLEDRYYNNLDKDFLKYLGTRWYNKYYDAFGDLNMRYNVHLMSHLQRIREQGSFPEISAFPFEGSFAAAARGQQVGTSSLGLQSMRYTYLRPLKGHLCKKKISFDTKTTSRRQNDLLHSERSCFQLVETPKPGDNFFKVRKLNVTTYFPPDGSSLDFTDIGVFKYLSTTQNVQYLQRDNVIGKLFMVPAGGMDILVSASFAQLREAE